MKKKGYAKEDILRSLGVDETLIEQGIDVAYAIAEDRATITYGTAKKILTSLSTPEEPREALPIARRRSRYANAVRSGGRRGVENAYPFWTPIGEPPIDEPPIEDSGDGLYDVVEAESRWPVSYPDTSEFDIEDMGDPAVAAAYYAKIYSAAPRPYSDFTGAQARRAGSTDEAARYAKMYASPKSKARYPVPTETKVKAPTRSRVPSPSAKRTLEDAVTALAADPDSKANMEAVVAAIRAL